MEKMLRLAKMLLCIGLITAFAGCAHSRPESAGQYVDDSIITARVKAAIFDDPTLKPLDINVKTYKGVVQLSGFVDSRESVRKAGAAASRVEGVSEVRNDLLVK